MTSFFHIYNRGVEKRQVFMDNADHARFIHDLWEFNSTAPVENNHSRTFTKNFTDTKSPSSYMMDVRRPSYKVNKLVDIHCYALMPNHYHMLVSPIDDDIANLSLFMKKLNGGYAKYFNEKYERSGTLWQGKFKKVQIISDKQLFYIPFYIHFNPLDLFAPEWRTRSLDNLQSVKEFLKQYKWSSHLDYIGIKNFPSVINQNFLLDLFSGTNGYKQEVNKALKLFGFDEINEVIIENTS